MPSSAPKKIFRSAIGTASLLLFAVGFLFAGSFDSATEVSVPGSKVKFKIWETQQDGATRFWYAINQDGAYRQPIEADYSIKLRYGNFDPSQDNAPQPTDPWLSHGSDTHLYLVQFHTQTMEAYLKVIQQSGGEIYKFMPHYTYIVRLSDTSRAQLENQSFVRWIGPYHPAYRIEEYMLENMGRAQSTFPLLRYNIMVMKPDQKAAVVDQINKLGGVVFRANAGKNLLEADLTPDQLFAIARRDEILYIDRWSEGETDMDIAREIGGANYVEGLEGWDGTGVRGEIMDLGFNMTHIDFNHHPLIEHTVVNSDSHGAACSGILFADGTGDPTARGMMPNGQGLVADWDVASTGTPRYNLTGELVQDPWNAVLQTSSVGSNRTTEYTTISADTDQALFDFDVLHCQSQSNAGDQMSRPQAWAKNILSGGGVNHQNTLDRSDDCWCGGGSIGPATDGRIKPDLAHFYDNIRTTTTGSNSAYTSTFGGTSGATPIICGHMGLIFQMWSEGIFGNTVTPGATVFENRPHMTTAKALAINTAFRYDFTGTGHDLTRVHQGWGMPDLRSLYDYREKIFVVNEDQVLTNLETATYNLSVLPGEPLLRVTMTYSDPPGTPGASMHRINDLSLHVVSPSGTEYWGNNGLLTGNFSTPGGSANVVDTVENVFIANPETGTWTVEVIASELNEDSHTETPGLDADFALVVTGATEGPGFSMEISPQRLPVCAPDNAVYEIDIQQFQGFSDPVTLSVPLRPAGTTISFSTNPVTPSGTSTMTVSGTNLATPGYYTFDVEADAAGINKKVLVHLWISNTAPGVVTTVVPANNAVDVSKLPTITWDAVDQAVDYLFELATEPTFAAPLVSVTSDQNLYQVASALTNLTTYYWRVQVSNGCGTGAWSSTFNFTTIDQPDYGTELFVSDNDLNNKTVAFVPNGVADFYDICGWDATELPTDPTGGTNITLTDDSSQPVQVSPAVSLYGVEYATIHVGSNGFITFTGGDSTNSESLANHFNQPRVSALFDDLNPGAGGTVSYKVEADHLAITYLNVLEFNTSNTNTFQIQFFHNGEIHITWLNIGITDGLAGLSAGSGVPADFLENDMSASGPCALPCPGDLNDDGQIDSLDLAMVLSAWGTADPLTDMDGDGLVTILDLNILMNLYGACP